ncbi:TetR/AcrR family transcriptional regulator [Streptomyces fuscichromogenes]|uniref:TetR family transcriptional regulator n=1 Tax=Streptomyces fuscichromogenes TaxID=1324013 RepID=A0A917XBL3_9ACTN|nr:TetR family transcriptional regulator [Streptomyces fuscichromogenes]GGN04703.1 TetR family transcriptional regulator [Streptomyces fuscichromogenes]
MATRTRRSQRRTEALSRERIVEAAVELLDTAGESGLTFRALTERLATGPGAIYWHVANKDELLGAATDAVIAAAVTVGTVAGTVGAATGTVGAATEGSRPATGEPGTTEPPASPQDDIRGVALGLFDAIARHPWLATQLAAQLSRSPWGTVTPRIFESIGRRVRALDVPESSWFTVTSALVHYILGAAGQNAANNASARSLPPGVDRDRFIDTVSRAWGELDPDEYPFTRAVADQMRGHDDREQFLAGVDLVLAGITATHHHGQE